MAVNLKRSSGEDSDGGKTSRRKMLGWLTGAGLFGSAGLSAVSNFVFIKPRATYGQPQRFSVGKPEDYPSGTRAILAPRGICIVREGSKLAAISITCTHLGCTVQYRADLREIWCACHNGTYDLNGRNISGPPPRPLDMFDVHVRGDEVVVNRKREA